MATEWVPTKVTKALAEKIEEIIKADPSLRNRSHVIDFAVQMLYMDLVKKTKEKKKEER